jgi:glycosyltransferase involved in cell wall biosynthesis
VNTKKIKLIFFHPYSSIGGVDLSLSTIINNLNQKKYSIDFICIRRSKNAISLNRNVKIYELKTTRTLFSFFKFRKIIKKNLNANYEKTILFSNQNFANVILYFFTFNLRDKLKLIAFDRNHLDELNHFFSINDKFKKKILKFFMSLTYNTFDKVITNSNESSKELSKFIGKKVSTLYNPIKIKNIRSKPKKNMTNLNILNIGRLEMQKDHITLIRAVKILSKKINIKLKIVGSGSQYFFLKKNIKNLGIEKNIKIIKETRNTTKFFLSSDLFVSTSLYEGFPNVIVESIMHNIPVISSNCRSGPKEILIHDNATNMFKIKNYKDLANKILYFYFNKKKFNKNKFKIKENLNNFHYKKILNKFDQLFQKI